MITSKDMSNIYFWFDTEFTSLDLNTARLLQVAIIPTNAKLERVLPPEEDLNLFVHIGSGQNISPWVRENLPDLIKHCRSETLTSAATVNRTIGIWLEKNFGLKRDDISKRPLLAGNSLQCDWYMARKFLPTLIEYTHYRMLDVSSCKVHWLNSGRGDPFDKATPELTDKHLPFARRGEGASHDAYFDVQASIAEFNYYIEKMG